MDKLINYKDIKSKIHPGHFRPMSSVTQQVCNMYLTYIWEKNMTQNNTYQYCTLHNFVVYTELSVKRRIY